MIQLSYLILLTFEGPPPTEYGKKKGQTLARHLNDDLSDNHWSNLAWGTQVENVADAFRNERRGRGFQISSEHRAKISVANKGKKRTAAMRAAMMGHPVSAKTRAKISAANTGRSLSEAHKAKLRGKKASPETRAKMRAAHLNRPPISDEVRAKISAGLKARAPMTAETRAKIGAASKARQDAIRAARCI